MSIKFEEIVSGFDYVSVGQMDENQAFLNKETGQVVWHTETGDNFEELPDDIEDEKYIQLPHKNDLNLGRSLVFEFASEFLPNDYEKIKSIFRSSGAYFRYKELLDSKDMLDKWHEFEAQAEDQALREWCEENEIKLVE